MPTYRLPNYLKEAAKVKYGKDIFFLGVTSEDISQFWSAVERNAVAIGDPYEIGRTVVDIDAKSHINTGETADEPDDFKIVSSQTKDQVKTSSTTYQVQLAAGENTTKGASVSTNFNLKVGGPAFFNMATYGLRAETTGQHVQSLSQTYEVEGGLKVPSRTKVRAVIKTWAVTHEADAVVRLSVSAQRSIPVQYRPRFSRAYLGGIIQLTGYLTAKEIFVGEDDFNIKNQILTFKRKGKITYLSEEVELTKVEAPIELEM